jgi:hypothetical protein
VVATLGSPAPDGDYHEGDFEPGHINFRGDLAFASDLAHTPTSDPTAIFGEGLYARYHGTTRRIARAGDLIDGTSLKYRSYGSPCFPPAGATCTLGILSPAGMNDRGEVAFGFGVEQYRYAGVFRYDPHSSRCHQ